METNMTPDYLGRLLAAPPPGVSVELSLALPTAPGRVQRITAKAAARKLVAIEIAGSTVRIRGQRPMPLPGDPAQLARQVFHLAGVAELLPVGVGPRLSTAGGMAERRHGNVPEREPAEA